jgi:pyruvate dehydrogenase complex dehydrogenase (E1) component
MPRKPANGSTRWRRSSSPKGRSAPTSCSNSLIEEARQTGIDMPFSANTGYVNSIEPEDEERSPGNLELEGRLRAYMRWNAMALVVKANRLDPADGGDLGGHISSFASVAHMFAAGFNHFWHADSEGHGGDLLYIQGHSAPGIYARAYMEGRLTEEQLLNFRQEVDGKGLSSYPHPKLMPEFWQFPTVSMGLGPLMAIYQARFLKYLHARGIADTSQAQGLGVLRRRRDGRAREPGRHRPGGAREAGQPDLRRQLQPAAPGRPGARQRQDHPGTRRRIPRLRLERASSCSGAATGTRCWRATRTVRCAS